MLQVISCKFKLTVMSCIKYHVHKLATHSLCKCSPSIMRPPTVVFIFAGNHRFFRSHSFRPPFLSLSLSLLPSWAIPRVPELICVGRSAAHTAQRASKSALRPRPRFRGGSLHLCSKPGPILHQAGQKYVIKYTYMHPVFMFVLYIFSDCPSPWYQNFTPV